MHNLRFGLRSIIVLILVACLMSAILGWWLRSRSVESDIVRAKSLSITEKHVLVELVKNNTGSPEASGTIRSLMEPLEVTGVARPYFELLTVVRLGGNPSRLFLVYSDFVCGRHVVVLVDEEFKILSSRKGSGWIGTWGARCEENTFEIEVRTRDSGFDLPLGYVYRVTPSTSIQFEELARSDEGRRRSHEAAERAVRDWVLGKEGRDGLCPDGTLE